jgi:hypothetical protein
MKSEQQIRLLQIELEKARQENTRLRKALGENGLHARRVQQAYEDAVLLSTAYCAGIIPSRRYGRSLGLTQTRWEHATALLKLARVIIRQRHWSIKDPMVIEKRLAGARDRALSDPNLFFLRHSRHRRWGA